MRILFCNFEYPPLGGGGGVINALLAEELARHHDVTVLTSRALGLPARSEERRVQVVRVPTCFRRQQAVANLPSMFAFMLTGYRWGRRLLAAETHDVINTHFALPTGPVGDALARHAGLPNVLSVHGGDIYDPSKLTSPHRHPALRLWIRRLAARADLVVGASRNTLDNLRRFYAPACRTALIPLAIARPPRGAARRETYGFAADEVLLVTVGRLVRRKAVDQLVAMMRALPGRARLVVVGSGPEERPLRAAAAAGGVADRVCFLGQVEETEKFRVLRMADVYVTTSQHEGFGLVFLEAMACGLPVVAYDHGGQTDFLRDGETGSLAALNDLDGFTERCARLIADADRRRTLGARNLRDAERFFIDACARRYVEAFAQVIQARAAQRVTSPLSVQPV
jgi:glycosyltransferase involved in cell wall biosynthesis